MKIKIEIECDTIREFYTHLTVLRQDIRKQTKKLNLDPINDEFPADVSLDDDNCYGTHEVEIIL